MAGGNFASGYHWQDGIGARRNRPARRDTAWRKFESNEFGTEPYLCLNMGTGTMEEATAWLEYCNGTGETYWSQERMKLGHRRPHGVHYWGLGNEVYGPWQAGYKSAAAYAEQAREFAKLLRWTDRDVRLIACGGGDPEWDWEVLRTAGHVIDYISYHDYFRPDPAADPYYSLVARGFTGGRYIRDLWGLIEAARHRYAVRRPIHICVDEWNVFYRRSDFSRFGTLHEEKYDLVDALCVASYLNTLVRNAHAVKMANLAQLVNVIAPIFTSPDGMLLQSIYYPLLMHATHRGSVALDAYTESETFDVSDSAVPFVHVASALSATGGRLYVYAVNLHREQSAHLDIRLAELSPHTEVTVSEVAGASVDAVNSFADPNAVGLAVRPMRLSEATELPPHSARTIIAEIGRD